MNSSGRIKIVILNTSERNGGAAIAANRLMKALQKTGVEASMLVLHKQTNDLSVVSVQRMFTDKIRAKWNFLLERFFIYFENGFSRKNLFKVSIANTGFDISNHPLVQSADIIHLHWINHGFLSLSGIQRLIQLGKPVVWTLHDMWAATAICHYASDCEKYKDECFSCPLLKGNEYADLSLAFFRKKTFLSLEKICYVGCSGWISRVSKQSFLLKSAPFSSIPNPIDMNIFRPLSRKEGREYMELPQDKLLILFSAAKISDQRKGGIYFIEACKYILSNYPDLAENIEIVLMGEGNPEFFNQLSMKITVLHYISGEKGLATVYSAVDVFVIPSLEDNLPNTIMESMACGTPCVGFNVGGIPEMIDHKTNGYVAEYKNSEDLAEGIRYIFENSEEISMSSKCIEKVSQCYSESVIVENYIELYKSLLRKKTERYE